MNAPIVTFRSKSAPYSILSSLSYVQSAFGGDFLPVKEGEASNILSFRIYNNFNSSQSVATVFNAYITTYDGVGAGSHTATQSPVSQSWVHIYETGFGESTSSPGNLTSYIDIDTAIGRSGVDQYSPIYGSNGGSGAYIRAGIDGNGVGFIEFNSYAQVPDGAGFANYNFAVSINYDWTT